MILLNNNIFIHDWPKSYLQCGSIKNNNNNNNKNPDQMQHQKSEPEIWHFITIEIFWWHIFNPGYH